MENGVTRRGVLCIFYVWKLTRSCHLVHTVNYKLLRYYLRYYSSYGAVVLLYSIIPCDSGTVSCTTKQKQKQISYESYSTKYKYFFKYKYKYKYKYPFKITN